MKGTFDSNAKEILVHGEATPVSMMSRQKRLYWERKNNNLCPKCGIANDDGKVLCPGCRARQNEYVKQNRLFYSSLGLCSRCGRNRVFKGEKLCLECRAIEAAKRAHYDSCISEEKKAERSKKKSEYRHKIYWERVEQGVCIACGRRRAAAGKRMCGICAHKDGARHREKYRMEHIQDIPRENRVQNGLCFNCGGSLDMEGKKICSSCYSRQIEVLKNAHVERKTGEVWRQDNNAVFRKKTTMIAASQQRAAEIFHTAPYAGAFKI